MRAFSFVVQAASGCVLTAYRLPPTAFPPRATRPTRHSRPGHKPRSTEAPTNQVPVPGHRPPSARKGKDLSPTCRYTELNDSVRKRCIKMTRVVGGRDGANNEKNY